MNENPLETGLKAKSEGTPEQLEQRFRELLLEIDNLELRKTKHKELTEKIENGEMELKDACLAIEDFVEKRGLALLKLFTISEHASKEERGALMQAINCIRSLQKDRAINHIDSGMVASVQFLTRSPGLCMKIIRDFGSRYTTGNDVRKEMQFLDDLCETEVANIRVPEPVAAIKTDRLHAIVMERLNAVSIRNIIEQEIPIPEGFDFDDFFSRIHKFMDVLHEKRIFHRDLHWGNIMVNLKTGEGYVIDFGIGIDLGTTSTGAKVDPAEQEMNLADLDKASLRAQVIAPLKKYLKEKSERFASVYRKIDKK